VSALCSKVADVLWLNTRSMWLNPLLPPRTYLSPSSAVLALTDFLYF
jgi:hypothetical protein